MIHICTDESLLAGGFEMTGYCPVCCRENQKISVGWVGSKCHGCGQIHSSEDMPGLMRQRRRYLGMTRKQIAEVLGVTRKTVSNYENVWPSATYWKKTRALVEASNA